MGGGSPVLNEAAEHKLQRPPQSLFTQEREHGSQERERHEGQGEGHWKHG
jgi:hypothetical protein